MNLDHLPSELILHIVSFLDPADVVRCQTVSSRFCSLTRSNELWKTICFDNSRVEALRRRRELFTAQEPSLAALRRAMSNLPDSRSGALEGPPPSTEMHAHQLRANERIRAMANWNPAYPDEQVDFYEEYIHRHASISLRWLQPAMDGTGDTSQQREVTGVGTLCGDGRARTVRNIVAPLDDGSVAVWDALDTREDDNRGRLMARTRPGLLTDTPSSRSHSSFNLSRSRALMTETQAVDCVSVDSGQKRAFFAVQNQLNEVDLETMVVVNRSFFPFHITALSEAIHPTPLTVGTNMTLHLHDPRAPPIPRTVAAASTPRARVELTSAPSRRYPSDVHRILTGDVPRTHATLSQPGPTSILHLPHAKAWTGNGDIFVAGRFTSILNYDRRFFPRLRGTIHSGARLSSLISLPHPFLPRASNLSKDSRLSVSEVQAAKAIPGSTLVAAGEYKGKGSLELFRLSSEPRHATLSSDPFGARLRDTVYQNRQTASRSKLLGVAAHGTKLVFSDGDGALKWVERDGSTEVRSWSIDETSSSSSSPASSSSPSAAAGHLHPHSPSGPRANNNNNSSSSTDAPSDIVQKIVPTRPGGGGGGGGSVGTSVNNRNDLLLWTGEGRLAFLGFGHKQGKGQGEWEEGMLEAEELFRRNEERAYGSEMRRALERQADEVRFIRGLGL